MSAHNVPTGGDTGARPIAEYVPVSRSRLPRWAHRLYAWAVRYFWLPCPRCGRYFGGHEPNGPTLWNDERQVEGRLTCCARIDGSPS